MLEPVEKTCHSSGAGAFAAAGCRGGRLDPAGIIPTCLEPWILFIHIQAAARAIAGLCEELNATETLYPGTKFRLVYSVKGI